ncbi:MAG: hypothetical protein LN589_02785 [Rickettsia endosymbiont of Eriopis connexa]|nr:hypothetical protein [Rickettsia endosymbiont of Eriopis connexa]
MTDDKTKNQLNTIMTPELKEAFYYIIDAGRHKNYDDAMDCITQNLQNPNEILQIAALQALQLLNPRVCDIENKLISPNKLVLPILFENLKSKSDRILHETMDTLSDIAYLIPQLKREIYLAYFENGIDFLLKQS